MREPSADRVDYDRLYREQRQRVLRLCRLLLSDPEEAEEVAQEVFVRAFRRWGAEGAPESWPKWLARVAVNACRDRYRSAWWRLWRGRSRELSEGDGIGTTETPDQELIKRERWERVWQRFQKLSRRQQEIFVLRHLEGWSTEEVSEVLGVTTGAVKQHLFRAVCRLREAIEN